LLGEDRALVTPVAGTTRDVIEEYANINGIPVCFADTAGIRNHGSMIEKLGVERSRKTLSESDLVLFVLDGSRPFTKSDLEIAQACPTTRTVVVINKADLPGRTQLPTELTTLPSCHVSALREIDIDTVRHIIFKLVTDGIEYSADGKAHINQRHEQAIASAIAVLGECRSCLQAGEGIEIGAQLARAALNYLGEILGVLSTDDILERVFASFCIGK
jgi:tRNA modification GTPase